MCQQTPYFTECTNSDDNTIYIYLEIKVKGGKIQISSSESRRSKNGWHIAHVETNIYFLRRGYGKAIVEETCRRLWEREPLEITLDALPQNHFVGSLQPMVAAQRFCNFILWPNKKLHQSQAQENPAINEQQLIDFYQKCKFEITIQPPHPRMRRPYKNSVGIVKFFDGSASVIYSD